MESKNTTGIIMDVRNRQWKEMCPLIFQETEISRLPQKFFKKIMSWEYCRKGIILCGPTQSCKSRMMWLLMEKFQNGQGTSWITWLSKHADVVFFDDLGKGKLTERSSAELFHVIDSRASSGMPTFITTNLLGPSLSKKLSKDLSDPLNRRLSEFFDVLIITK